MVLKGENWGPGGLYLDFKLIILHWRRYPDDPWRAEWLPHHFLIQSHGRGFKAHPDTVPDQDFDPKITFSLIFNLTWGLILTLISFSQGVETDAWCLFTLEQLDLIISFSRYATHDIYTPTARHADKWSDTCITQTFTFAVYHDVQHKRSAGLGA